MQLYAEFRKLNNIILNKMLMFESRAHEKIFFLRIHAIEHRKKCKIINIPTLIMIMMISFHIYQ